MLWIFFFLVILLPFLASYFAFPPPVGSLTVKPLPLTSSLSTSMLPPLACTRFLETASPSLSLLF